MKSKNICRWCKKNGLLCMLLIILLICSFSPTIEGAQEKVSGEGGAANAPSPPSGKRGRTPLTTNTQKGPPKKQSKRAIERRERAEQAAARDRSDGT